MADRTALDVLLSIESLLKTALAATPAARPAAQAAPAQAANKPVPTGGVPPAPDADLDSKWGDPVLKFIPRDWTGSQEFKGLPFSQCPPELLDQTAEVFEYFARKAAESNELTASGKPVADFKRLDAARAKGWAARKRSGWKPAVDLTDTTTDDGWGEVETADEPFDGIPF